MNKSAEQMKMSINAYQNEIKNNSQITKGGGINSDCQDFIQEEMLHLVSLTRSLAVLVGHEKLLVVWQLETTLNCHGSEQDVGLVLLDMGDLHVL